MMGRAYKADLHKRHSFKAISSRVWYGAHGSQKSVESLLNRLSNLSCILWLNNVEIRIKDE